jgi:YHS domain-containing protein
MAEVIQHRRGQRSDRTGPGSATGAAGPVETSASEAGPAAAPGRPAVPVAIDPVCGMEVAIQGARQVLEYNGQRRFFCCPACRQRFAAEPARYLAGIAEAAPHPATPSHRPGRGRRGSGSGESDALPG